MKKLFLALLFLAVALNVAVEAGTAKILDEATRKVALDEHNRLRKQMAEGKTKNGKGETFPKAKDMYKLTYSEKMEEEGRKWMDQCKKMQHTPGINYGQNLCGFMPPVDPPAAIKQCMEGWHDKEVAIFPDVTPKYDERLGGLKVGHFTQVCNYEGPGNLIGGKMYEAGETCSACPAGSKCKDSLCVECGPKAK